MRRGRTPGFRTIAAAIVLVVVAVFVSLVRRDDAFRHPSSSNRVSDPVGEHAAVIDETIAVVRASVEASTRITGSVIALDTREPLAGANIVVYTLSGALYERGTLADDVVAGADGSFVAEVPEACDKLRIHARNPGFMEQVEHHERSALPDPLVLEVQRILFGRLAGRVVDGRQTGVGEATIRIEPPVSRLFEHRSLREAGVTEACTTSPTGDFTISRYPINEPLNLTVDAGPYRTMTQLERVPITEDLVTKPIVLLPASHWTIRTTDKNGAPAPRIAVRVTMADAALEERVKQMRAANRRMFGAETERTITTDDAGVAVAERVARGRYILEAIHGESVMARLDVVLEHGEQESTLIVDRIPGITVLFRDDSGEIIPAATLAAPNGIPLYDAIDAVEDDLGVDAKAIVLDVRVTVSDGAGRITTKNPLRPLLRRPMTFDIAEFPASVEATLGDSSLGLTKATSPGETIEFVLSNAAIVDYAQKNCAIISFDITAQNGELPRNPWAIVRRLLSDASGYDAVGAVRPGHVFPLPARYLVSPGPGLLMVRASGCAMRTVTFDAAPRAWVDLGTLRLATGGTFDLAIQAADWTGNARISMVRYPEGTPVYLERDLFRQGLEIEVPVPPGTLSHRAIDPGEYLLRVEADGCAMDERRLTIVAHQSTPVEVHLHAEE